MNDIETLQERTNRANNGGKVMLPKERTNIPMPPLPPDRIKAVEYGLAQFQQVGHERDELRRENIALRDDLAALRIQCEGLTSQLSEVQSQISSAMLIRDQALAGRIKYEALFVLMQAQLRAFAVPAEPLITNDS